MEIAKVECDNKRCRAPMNGSGYYLSHEKCEGGIRMAIIKSEHNPPGDWQNHYCGKACLMLALNEIAEEITETKAGGDTDPDSPEHLGTHGTSTSSAQATRERRP